ncbi:MAG: V-type ATP synthase subunit E [Thermoproteota archaeon]
MKSANAISGRTIQKAKKKAEAILKEAQKSVRETLEKQRELGNQRATEKGETILKGAEEEAEIEKRRIIQNAKIEANLKIVSKKEQLTTEVLNETKNRLKTLTQSKEYPSILEKLIIESCVILGEKELEVLLNKQDLTLSLNLNRIAERVKEKTGIEIELIISKENPEIIGGALIQTMEGKTVMYNTFTDILSRREKELRLKIAQILFRS